jgi:2'-5' RNA ligase
VRLFVAINLPEPEKQRLSKKLAQIDERYHLPVRWVSPDSLHITLKFLGEVAEPMLPRLKQALAQAVTGTAAFDVAISGFGAFPSSSRPNIFWVGAESVPALIEVQRRIEAVTAPLGFETEARAYTPHITVGKAQKDARVRDRGTMDRIARDFDYKTVLHVRSVDLMRSHLGGQRPARYEVLERMELR